jgi:hypothetical protein
MKENAICRASNMHAEDMTWRGKKGEIAERKRPHLRDLGIDGTVILV